MILGKTDIWENWAVGAHAGDSSSPGHSADKGLLAPYSQHGTLWLAGGLEFSLFSVVLFCVYISSHLVCGWGTQEVMTQEVMTQEGNARESLFISLKRLFRGSRVRHQRLAADVERFSNRKLCRRSPFSRRFACWRCRRGRRVGCMRGCPRPESKGASPPPSTPSSSPSSTPGRHAAATGSHSSCALTSSHDGLTSALQSGQHALCLLSHRSTQHVWNW